MSTTPDNVNEANEPEVNKPLSFFEVLAQAFSLMFALQNKSGRKRLLDLAESNPFPLLLAGVSAMALFFIFCFVSSQIVIRYLA